jgi:hypothetical protein
MRKISFFGRLSNDYSVIAKSFLKYTQSLTLSNACNVIAILFLKYTKSLTMGSTNKNKTMN